MSDARPGDLVIIQFGHNDLHPVDDPRERGTLPGIDDQTQQVTRRDGQAESVYTYGHYLRGFVREAKSRGITPIVMSWVPVCPATDGHTPPAPKPYAQWAQQVAEQEGAVFLDIHQAISEHYQTLDPAEIKRRYFTPSDDVHTNEEGARVNAKIIVQSLSALDIIDFGPVQDPTYR